MRWVAVTLCLAATPALAEDITAARYADPTDRYAHGILGDAIEWGALVLETDAGRSLKLSLPQTRVFEDTNPRLADVDGDGDTEVVVVETDVRRGARISVYDTTGLVAANDFIGRTNRWLAPVGIADIDGDGRVEIAYIDRPHLAKVLTILEFVDGQLRPEATFHGVTNHRIGERDIAGGIRDCGAGPEMVVATDTWSRVVAVLWNGSTFDMKDLGPHQGRASFAAALDC